MLAKLSNRTPVHKGVFAANFIALALYVSAEYDDRNVIISYLASIVSQ
jgi:hypothetical protein